MEIQRTAFEVRRDGLTIRGTHFREADGTLPVAILCHGFGGVQKDQEFYAQRLAKQGFWAFTFDFCGGSPNSSSDGRFGDMTVFTEKADLEAVMDYACSLPGAESSGVSLLGCSQGGFVCALTAAANPERVKRLVMFYPALCIPEDSRRGHMLVFSFDPENVPDAIPPVPEGAAWIKESLGGEYVRSVQRMDAFSAIASYPGPVLIVHGDRDRAVDVCNSRRAQIAYNAAVPLRCQLAEINGADHGFRGQEDETAIELAEQFLTGGTNVLTVDVVLTGCQKEQQGEQTVVTLPFGGVANTPFFRGLVRPGAADVQRWQGEQIVRLCADYVIEGHDHTGAPCSVHIVNTNIGSGWKATVTTDSEALHFLNGAELTESLEMRQVGPIVRIFAKI